MYFSKFANNFWAIPDQHVKDSSVLKNLPYCAVRDRSLPRPQISGRHGRSEPGMTFQVFFISALISYLPRLYEASHVARRSCMLSSNPSVPTAPVAGINDPSWAGLHCSSALGNIELPGKLNPAFMKPAIIIMEFHFGFQQGPL